MSTLINVEMLIVLVQERPELWDQRDAHYADRACKDAAWKRICCQMFPDYEAKSREEQERIMNDVTRRWRSCRDCYRREKQLRARSGAEATTKRKYLYFDRLNFLAPVMALRPTESNLTERETGTDSEVVIDPVGDVAEQAGPSSSLSTCTQEAPPPPPESESQPALPEEQAISSSPTMPLDASPQASGIPRRGRRRREGAGYATRRQVDRGVLDYLSTVARDDGEEAYGRSLAQYFRAIPRVYRLRTRGAIQIVLDFATPPNNPTTIFEYLERWQISNANSIQSHVSHQEQGESASQPPPPPPPPTPARMPTPPPQPAPITNVPQQVQYMGHSSHAHYGHLNIPNVVGWPQHGYGRHGHIGGYNHSGQHTQDYPQHFQSYHYQNPQMDPGRILQNPGLSATTHGDTEHVQQPRQTTQSGPPPSPPPTYHQL